jgi:hypothetical protein
MSEEDNEWKRQAEWNAQQDQLLHQRRPDLARDPLYYTKQRAAAAYLKFHGADRHEIDRAYHETGELRRVEVQEQLLEAVERNFDALTSKNPKAKDMARLVAERRRNQGRGR